MILKAQDIKPGMVIYLPNLNETFTISSIEILNLDLGKRCAFFFFDEEENAVGAITNASIPVVGFANKD